MQTKPRAKKKGKGQKQRASIEKSTRKVMPGGVAPGCLFTGQAPRTGENWDWEKVSE